MVNFETVENFFEYVANRIYTIREAMGVSAQTMSIELGQNKAYINKIENKKARPSLEGLYYILDYFNMSAQEFFDKEIKLPNETVELIKLSKKLTPDEMNLVIEMCRHLTHRKE